MQMRLPVFLRGRAASLFKQPGKMVDTLITGQHCNFLDF